MDQRLVAWARSVKSRQRHRQPLLPPLWLFTDAPAMPDLPGIVRRLPSGLCGVVFRHDSAPGRSHLARQIWQLCRQRRLIMVVAGRPLPGIPAGPHLRGGRGRSNPARFSTSSAHSPDDLVRARRKRVDAIFLSPTFPTASHPGTPALGIVRWTAMARRFHSVPILALGGITGRTAHRLPRTAQGVGAIGALLAR